MSVIGTFNLLEKDGFVLLTETTWTPAQANKYLMLGYPVVELHTNDGEHHTAKVSYLHGGKVIYPVYMSVLATEETALSMAAAAFRAWGAAQ